MRCYKCNAVLSESEFCNKCGADVAMYKKIIRSSEAHYNQGLSKAQARDLTGAADALRRSIKLNKQNINARNLLGLVYFEMGEAVAALSQWVISKNLQPEKNIADNYLNEIKKNASRLETINQTIKKYNQALAYAKQDSHDLAVIQLKKVLNMNPNLIKGYQLLALLYIDNNEHEKAAKQLKKAIAIDKNNPLTLQYLNEVNGVLKEKEKKGEGKAKKVQERPRPKISGDDVIIPPTNYKDTNTGGLTILNVVIGIAIGIAAAWFLMLPAKEKNLSLEYQKNFENMSSQLSNYGVQVSELEREKEELSNQISTLQSEIESYASAPDISTEYEKLLLAMQYYEQGSYLEAAEKLNEIDANFAQSETYAAVYQQIRTDSVARAIRGLYDTGYNQYRNQENYEAALESFQRAYALDANAVDSALLYYMGRCYQRLGDADKGNECMDMVLERFPNDGFAKYAREYKTN